MGREWIVARIATTIFVLVALTANQWRYVVLFHTNNRPTNWQVKGRIGIQGIDETHPFQQEHHRQRHNTTRESKNQHLYRHSSPGAVIVNEIIHRAFFGLGHRLHRSAASYHLAQSLSLPSTFQNSTSVPDISRVDEYQQQSIITHLRFHWESCLAGDAQGNSTPFDGKEEEKKEYNVFRYLFGHDLWELNDQPENSRIASKDRNGVNNDIFNFQNRRNMIVLRNDVPGYIAGQLYKDLQLPVRINTEAVSSRINETKQFSSTTTTSSNQLYEYDAILNKVMYSDVQFYHRLVENYRFQLEIQDFQIQYKWSERPLVIGLHLRAGNGEGAHFEESGRASSKGYNETTMITRLMKLINKVTAHEIKRRRERNEDIRLENQRHHEQSDVLAPLLFVATDTAHLIPLIEKATKLATNDDGNSRLSLNELHFLNATTTRPKTVPLQIVTWPQNRLPKNSGVGFDILKGKGDRCLESWKSAMSDVLMLSKVDVLIAAKRSTFTQSLPLALGFDRNRKDTEINEAGDADSDVASKDASSSHRQFSFCEVSESDTARITCFASMLKWLFRGEDDQNGTYNKYKGEDVEVKSSKVDPGIFTFYIPVTTIINASDQQQKNEQVDHKVTVLLPDVVPPKEFEEARDFLRRESAYDSKATVNESQTREQMFRYGRSKIYKRYRNANKENGMMVSPKTSSRWNLVYDTPNVDQYERQ
uniref:Uncharacterized protein n=1 Tax=Pseudo-nitzschia australis TaxID=44445 RepID=A0A7S4EJU7_9STRA